MVVLVKQICCDCIYKVFQSREGSPTACKKDLWQDQSINLMRHHRDWATLCQLFEEIKEIKDA